jgi:hypothetical protein
LGASDAECHVRLSTGNPNLTDEDVIYGLYSLFVFNDFKLILVEASSKWGANCTDQRCLPSVPTASLAYLASLVSKSSSPLVQFDADFVGWFAVSPDFDGLVLLEHHAVTKQCEAGTVTPSTVDNLHVVNLHSEFVHRFGNMHTKDAHVVDGRKIYRPASGTTRRESQMCRCVCRVSSREC